MGPLSPQVSGLAYGIAVKPAVRKSPSRAIAHSMPCLRMTAKLVPSAWWRAGRTEFHHGRTPLVILSVTGPKRGSRVTIFRYQPQSCRAEGVPAPVVRPSGVSRSLIVHICRDGRVGAAAWATQPPIDTIDTIDTMRSLSSATGHDSVAEVTRDGVLEDELEATVRQQFPLVHDIDDTVPHGHTVWRVQLSMASRGPVAAARSSRCAVGPG